MAHKTHSGVSIFSRILIAFLLVNLTTSAVLLLMGHDFVKGMIERRTTTLTVFWALTCGVGLLEILRVARSL